MRRSAHIVAPRTSLVSKFPCLLNLPPTNLEQSASFCGLSLPSVYRGQFQNLLRDPLKLQTKNTWPPLLLGSWWTMFRQLLTRCSYLWARRGKANIAGKTNPGGTSTHWNGQGSLRMSLVFLRLRQRIGRRFSALPLHPSPLTVLAVLPVPSLSLHSCTQQPQFLSMFLLFLENKIYALLL